MKFKQYKIFIYLFLLILLINLVNSEYTIVPNKRIDSVYPGDGFDLPFSISGMGKLDDEAKIYILVDEVFGINGAQIWGENQELAYSNQLVYIFIINQTETEEKTTIIRNIPKVIPWESARPDFSKPGTSSPPFNLYINVKKNIKENTIKGGDYNINIVMSYKENNEWKISKDVITIHVNSWYEQYEKQLTIIALILGLIGLISIKNESIRKRFNYLIIITVLSIIGYLVLNNRWWVFTILVILTLLIFKKRLSMYI